MRRWWRRERILRLVFHLITSEGPAAAIRHIFFTDDFFFFITNIN